MKPKWPQLAHTKRRARTKTGNKVARLNSRDCFHVTHVIKYDFPNLILIFLYSMHSGTSKISWKVANEDYDSFVEGM